MTYRTVEEYEEHLWGLSYEELFGTERLDKWAEEEIAHRLEQIQEAFEALDYETLLGDCFLDEMAEREIEVRVKAWSKGK